MKWRVELLSHKTAAQYKNYKRPKSIAKQQQQCLSKWKITHDCFIVSPRDRVQLQLAYFSNVKNPLLCHSVYKSPACFRIECYIRTSEIFSGWFVKQTCFNELFVEMLENDDPIEDKNAKEQPKLDLCLIIWPGNGKEKHDFRKVLWKTWAETSPNRSRDFVSREKVVFSFTNDAYLKSFDTFVMLGI